MVWIRRTKQNEKSKLCYINTDIFIFHVKTDNTYKEITKNVEKRFDTSNYKLEKPQQIEEKIHRFNERYFVWLRAKTCSYLTDDNDESKKAKNTKKFVIKKTT